MENDLTGIEQHLVQRPRRLRRLPALRRMVRETRLTTDDLISPLFVSATATRPVEIASMPGQYQWPVDQVGDQAAAAFDAGIPAVILFGLPDTKDPVGRENFDPQGVIQRAVRAIKGRVSELVVITDVCLCEYTDHGHCGLLAGSAAEFEVPTEATDPAARGAEILNDATLKVLSQVAISHAEAGADLVAPSGMMDGMVAAIRRALDERRYSHVGILSYSVKYASSFYGPFREAAGGAPGFGDRKTHQMDPANVREALREAALDVAQGADLLMVKPALAYLDVIRRLRDTWETVPLVAYNVSGEYSMLKAAAQRGWLDERSAVLELLTSIKRAGADSIITYHAMQAAKWLKTG